MNEENQHVIQIFLELADKILILKKISGDNTENLIEVLKAAITRKEKENTRTGEIWYWNEKSHKFRCGKEVL
jgi:hypothetical protein